MEQTFMKERPIKSLVLSMALPMVISMMVNSLYNIVDSYFAAKISEEAMTALSLVYPIQNLITSIAVGFSIGVNATIAFYLGAGNQKKADKAATDGVIFNIVHGALLLVGCWLGMPAFLRFFTSDETVIAYRLTYSRIAFSFSIVITVGIAFEKIFQSVGRMKVSMISMMAGCIANIILDPVFIFGIGPVPAMGIKGAAIATGIGQVITVLVYLWFVVFRPLPVRITFSKWYLDKDILGRLYGIGVPATFNMALPSFVISLLRYVVIIIPAAFVLSRFFEAQGVWMAFGVAELLTAVAAYGIFRRYYVNTVK